MTLRALERTPDDGAERVGSWRFELLAAVALQLFVLLGVHGLVGLADAGWLAAGAYLGLLCLGVATGWARVHRSLSGVQDPSLGPANLITLARSLLVGG